MTGSRSRPRLSNPGMFILGFYACIAVAALFQFSMVPPAIIERQPSVPRPETHLRPQQDSLLKQESADGISADKSQSIDAAVGQNEAVQVDKSMSSNAPAGQLRTDSRDATVMGMAMNYGLSAFERFVGSLRKSGFQGQIILAVSNEMKPGVENYLLEQKVTYFRMQIVNCTHDTAPPTERDVVHEREARTCIHPYQHLKARWSRFPLLRDLLKECEACTGPVLISDFRDVFFQRDPFGKGTYQVASLEMFEEHWTQRTTDWLVNLPVKKCKNLTLDKPMLCSGTTIGTREAMLKYLTVMHEETNAWMEDPNCCCNLNNEDDQSIHNYLYYTGRLPFAKAIPNRMGTVNTVGVRGSQIYQAHVKRCEEKWNKTQGEANQVPYDGAGGKYRWLGMQFGLTDEEGYFLQTDGTRSPVIHQYDRFGPAFYDKWINSRKGQLW